MADWCYREGGMSVRGESAAAALVRPLDTLVVESERVGVAEDPVATWDLRPADRVTLARFGVPRVRRVDPQVQQGREPELVHDQRSFYSLGRFSRLEIGLVPGLGEVRGIPSDEWSEECFTNSSVVYFVETAWRWYRVWKDVEQLQGDIELYDVLDDFLAFAAQLDPQVGTDDSSAWRGRIKVW
ncbi:SUKH-4 family immunity protein [Actinosynnema sp. NPDC050436]|uniref:SUKH-4 family immunity protein n=1 Tax=Actinosynnema sp. NPDC050436 TaxID=3155659 RepID=UPI003402867C